MHTHTYITHTHTHSPLSPTLTALVPPKWGGRRAGSTYLWSSVRETHSTTCVVVSGLNVWLVDWVCVFLCWGGGWGLGVRVLVLGWLWR